MRIKRPYVAGMMLYLLASASASAGFLAVHGGPTYDQATQTGYQNPRQRSQDSPPATAGCRPGKSLPAAPTRQPRRALGRFGRAATELGNLGTNSSGGTNVVRSRHQHRRHRRRLCGEVHR